MENRKECQSIHSVDNLQGYIKTVEYILSKDNEACLKQYVKGKRPYPQYYRPELYIINELDIYGIIRYHQFIGMLIC